MFRSHENIYNIFSAKKENIIKKSDDEGIKIHQEIQPLDETLFNLQFQEHVIRLKLEILNNHLSDPYSTNEKLDPAFKNALKELRSEYLASEKTRLGSGNKIYLDGKLEKITEDIVRNLLAEFLKKLDQKIDEQITLFNFSEKLAKMELGALITKLTEDQEAKSILIDELMDSKLIIQDQAYEIAEEAKALKEHNDELFKENISELENELPEIASKGDLTNLILKINSFPWYSSTKSVINKIGTNGVNALHAACSTGNDAIVLYLLNHGADPKIISDININPECGYLPLHYAVRCTDTTKLKMMVNLLLKHGANIDAKGIYNRTALHTAAFFGNYFAVKLLLNKGANPNAKESEEFSQTALHMAAKNNHATIVACLLKHEKTDPFALNSIKETPLVTALIAGSKDSVKTFIDCGYTLRAEDKDMLDKYSLKTKEMAQKLFREMSELPEFKSSQEKEETIYTPIPARKNIAKETPYTVIPSSEEATQETPYTAINPSEFETNDQGHYTYMVKIDDSGEVKANKAQKHPELFNSSFSMQKKNEGIYQVVLDPENNCSEESKYSESESSSSEEEFETPYASAEEELESPYASANMMR